MLVFLQYEDEITSLLELPPGYITNGEKVDGLSDAAVEDTRSLFGCHWDEPEELRYAVKQLLRLNPAGLSKDSQMRLVAQSFNPVPPPRANLFKVAGVTDFLLFKLLFDEGAVPVSKPSRATL